jgi:oxalate decarboxylase/phosphoglucose isomerase-like protein (cupin superfamily)
LEPSDRLGEELLVSNNLVRVWRDHLLPGKAQSIHTHQNPYLAIVIQGGIGQTVTADQTLLDSFNFEPGQALYFGPETLPVTHSLQNIGDQTLEILIVELLDSR